MCKAKWDIVLERVEARLYSGSAIFLSRGGKLILIHVVLQALPVYLMSLFMAPIATIKKLERLFRNFLWNDKDGSKKTHLVRREMAKCNKDNGGLGVKDLKMLNASLLMKWMWQFGYEKLALWRIIVAEKYGEDSFGWLTKPTKKAYGCSVWKPICKNVEFFSFNCKMQVGDGSLTSFWGDRWLTDTPLKDLYPDVYAVSVGKEATVAEVRILDNDMISWNLNISRRVYDGVILELTSLLT